MDRCQVERGLFYGLLLHAPGVPVTVMFQRVMGTEQRAWLRSTAVPLRSITFCLEETRSHVVMELVRPYTLCRSSD